MNIHLFGSTSLTGIKYHKLIKEFGNYNKIFPYSSSKKSNFFFDLSIYKNCQLKDVQKESLIISFAPIWMISDFLETCYQENPENLSKVIGFIICSSSSSYTKKFSSNNFDKKLSSNLINAENKIINISKILNKRCIIIQPSLIYGSIGERKDKNIYKIIRIISKLPFIILPNETGLRQPIHISQLAELFFKYSKEISKTRDPNASIKFSKILVGGDSELTYEKMIRQIIKKINFKRKKIYCKIIKIPYRLFLILFFPLIIFSPKTFESIQRITVDLAGFKKVSSLIKKNSENFPLEPFG